MNQYMSKDPLTYLLLNKENLHNNYLNNDNDNDNKSNSSTPSFCRSVQSLSPRSLSPNSKRSSLTPISVSPYTKYGSKYTHLFGYNNINESPAIEVEEKDSPFCLWAIQDLTLTPNNLEITTASPSATTIEVNTISTSPFNIIEVTTVAKTVSENSLSNDVSLNVTLPVASPLMKVKRNKSSKKEKALLVPFEKLTTRSNNKVALLSYLFLWCITLFSSTIQYTEFWKSFDPILKYLMMKPFKETHNALTEVHELRVDINDEMNKLSGKFIHCTIDVIANQLSVDHYNEGGSFTNLPQNLEQNALPINTINPNWKDSSFESIFINFN